MADPPIPPQAITAAAVAIHDVDCSDDRCSGSSLGHCHKLARAALEAAAPHLAAAEREACARLAEDEAATLAASEGTGHRALRRYAALLREDPHAT